MTESRLGRLERAIGDTFRSVERLHMCADELDDLGLADDCMGLMSWLTVYQAKLADLRLGQSPSKAPRVNPWVLPIDDSVARMPKSA